MPENSWERIKDIVDGAIRLTPAERPSYIDDACKGDASIRREVESLLSSFEKADSFLEVPAFGRPTLRIKTLDQGQMIGRYEIERKLGEGGMGIVYLARDQELDRAVAIKVLHPQYERYEDNVQRFAREAKAASALNHPNILTIYEIGEFEGSPYIVSEYIEGVTLRDKLRTEKPDLPTLLDISRQIAGALAAAHKARIVHRDIKPENIIVRDDGYVKVLDFGLAKLIEDKPGGLPTLSNSGETVSGLILGTVNYMSPEQARGEKVDERTDIFSLGAVMYEMITGKAPFAGNSMPETFANLVERDPEPISNYVSGVPEAITLIISKLLAKRREDRFQSVREAEEAIKAVAGGISGSSFERLRQPINENRTVLMQQTTGGGGNTTAASTSPYVAWHRRWPALAALSIFLVAGLSVGAYFLTQSSLLSANEIRSVAVMPFVNESGDPDVEYLSDGMTDTLISSLSELPNIKVKARTSVFRYKGKEIDPKAIGRDLGVQAIVNGRVVQRDGRTNVTLEVINTETEDVIFSTSYNKAQADLVTLQREIARDVSGKLKTKLSDAEKAKVAKAHTADPEALQLYLRGQFYAHKGGRNNVLQAIEFFNQAIEKDPNYALAYAGLALTYDSFDLYNIAARPEYEPKARAAAMRAVELDDLLAEAHVASGKFQAGTGAEQEFRRAIELDPNNAEAHHALSLLLTYAKRFDEAITEGKKARELDPLSSIITTDLGVTYAFARRTDEAIELFARAHEMDPTLFVPLGYLGFAQTMKGQYTEAVATFRRAIDVSNGAPNAKSHLAYALAKTGQRDEAQKLIDELKQQAAREYVSSFHFAVPQIALGNHDEAFFWLEKGVAEQSITFATLDIHPWYDDLRSDPRFAALLERLRPQNL
jgi:serine/threonine protein kinase/Flp pilus assembly protein TadD